jgi:SRSO17 transposase
VQLQTKPEIALALLDQAREWGVPHARVTADADYEELLFRAIEELILANGIEAYRPRRN